MYGSHDVNTYESTRANVVFWTYPSWKPKAKLCQKNQCSKSI